MSTTAGTDDVIEVSADGLSVQKTFTADEFPVPAIRFEIESDHDEQVAVRLSEDIPESFPMDKVGFHPDYHSDDWTAFQDNHVEFTGQLTPDETLVTVYGIRIDDESDAEPFMTEPEIVEVSSDGEGGSDAEAIDDDVIGNIVENDRNQPVKDMISGESDSVPGLEDTETTDDDAAEAAEEDDQDDDGIELDLDLGDVDTEPEPVDDDETEDNTPDIDLGFGEDEIPDSDDEDEEHTTDLEIELDDENEDNEEAIELDIPDEDTETLEDDADSESEDEDTETLEEDADSEAEDEDAETLEDDADPETVADPAQPAADTAAEPTAFDGSVLDQLVTELRDGEIDEADRELLRSELDLEPSGPEIAKVEHLQSRIEEVAAYTDALEQFLEDNGTGKQLIEDVQADLESIDADLDEMDDRVGGTEGRLDDVEDDLEAVDDDVEALEDDVTDLADDVDDLEADVDDVGDDLEDVEESLEDVEDELEDVRADVTDIQEWRDQLGSMFSN